MNESLSIYYSGLALILSIITMWLTLLRGGSVKMTQPTVVFFGPDSGGGPKVYLRTLLYATGKRGRIIESMYVKIRAGESTQNFNIWVYGDGKLARGSGLFVGSEGVACNHHFLLPKNASFTFSATEYTVEVYANLVHARKPLLLHRAKLSIPSDQVVMMRESDAGIYFDWGPDSGGYSSHVEKRPAGPDEYFTTSLTGSAGGVLSRSLKDDPVVAQSNIDAIKRRISGSRWQLAWRGGTRPMAFHLDGRIIEGVNEFERTWQVSDEGKLQFIDANNRLRAILAANADLTVWTAMSGQDDLPYPVTLTKID